MKLSDQTGSEDIKENAMKLESLVDGAFKKIDPVLLQFYKIVWKSGNFANNWRFFGDLPCLLNSLRIFYCYHEVYMNLTTMKWTCSLTQTGNGDLKVNAGMIKSLLNNMFKGIDQVRMKFWSWFIRSINTL